ncbi:VirK/YbjX family protein [Erwinia tracheiphila]|nr:VirK/YbjX family protein [Erwinia tracheiphila]UIA88454.1 VirK/YbjX family protein [Erwinia tracheiphila]UIA91888.1 VirK/YbjX family protein [Erwinia tracheiphila]UIA96832.1 VirK/YbjX family protein [Erwinia tracheiphila]
MFPKRLLMETLQLFCQATGVEEIQTACVID